MYIPSPFTRSPSDVHYSRSRQSAYLSKCGLARTDLLSIHRYFSGFVNRDVAFLHASSRTLIQADLIFNLPATEQVSYHLLDEAMYHTTPVLILSPIFIVL